MAMVMSTNELHNSKCSMRCSDFESGEPQRIYTCVLSKKERKKIRAIDDNEMKDINFHIENANDEETSNESFFWQIY